MPPGLEATGKRFMGRFRGTGSRVKEHEGHEYPTNGTNRWFYLDFFVRFVSFFVTFVFLQIRLQAAPEMGRATGKRDRTWNTGRGRTVNY
jgi:hypothetical protein